jgi:hypothetical protein
MQNSPKFGPRHRLSLLVVERIANWRTTKIMTKYEKGHVKKTRARRIHACMALLQFSVKGKLKAEKTKSYHADKIYHRMNDVGINAYYLLRSNDNNKMDVCT